DPRADRRDVALQVDPAQFGFGQLRVALIVRVVPAALLRVRTARLVAGAAVSEIVLGAGEHAARGGEGGALQPADRGLTELGDEGRVLAEALVGASPAIVARHGDARREHPVDARGADF